MASAGATVVQGGDARGAPRPVPPGAHGAESRAEVACAGLQAQTRTVRGGAGGSSQLAPALEPQSPPELADGCAMLVLAHREASVRRLRTRLQPKPGGTSCGERLAGMLQTATSGAVGRPSQASIPASSLSAGAAAEADRASSSAQPAPRLSGPRRGEEAAPTLARPLHEWGRAAMLRAAAVAALALGLGSLAVVMMLTRRGRSPSLCPSPSGGALPRRSAGPTSTARAR
jgi:hypothetical protein